jgi:hypothetical protein
MDLGSPFQSLERVFTDFSTERLFYLVFLFSVILLINYKSGLTHHYDISYRISQVESLQELVEDDITQGDSTNQASRKEELTAIYDEIVDDVQSRQKPLWNSSLVNGERGVSDGFTLFALKILAATFFYLIYVFWASIWGEPGTRGQQVIGAMFFVILLATLGAAIPDFDNNWLTLGIPFLIQIVSFFVLGLYGQLRRQGKMP